MFNPIKPRVVKLYLLLLSPVCKQHKQQRQPTVCKPHGEQYSHADAVIIQRVSIPCGQPVDIRR